MAKLKGCDLAEKYSFNTSTTLLRNKTLIKIIWHAISDKIFLER